jgi:hypothetical protein
VRVVQRKHRGSDSHHQRIPRGSSFHSFARLLEDKIDIDAVIGRVVVVLFYRVLGHVEQAESHAAILSGQLRLHGCRGRDDKQKKVY